MENATYFQRLKTLIQRGIKAAIIPALLVNISFALLISIIENATEPSWDFTLRDGIFLTALNTGVFMSIVFVGIVLIGLVLAIWKSRLPNILAVTVGLIIGAIPLIAGNYMLYILFFTPSFRNLETFFGQFLLLFFIPDVVNILVLTYVGQKMNNVGVLRKSLSTKDN